MFLVCTVLANTAQVECSFSKKTHREDLLAESHVFAKTQQSCQLLKRFVSFRMFDKKLIALTINFFGLPRSPFGSVIPND